MSDSIAVPRLSRAPHVALWIAQGLLAALFGMAGVLKSTAPLADLAVDMKWVTEVPPGLVRFVGVTELLGAIGLVLPSALRVAPKLTPLAAIGLAVTMLLAAAHHVRMGDPANTLVVNAVLGGIALAIAWGRLKVAPIAPRS